MVLEELGTLFLQVAFLTNAETRKTTVATELGNRLQRKGNVYHRIGIGADSRATFTRDISKIAQKMGMATADQNDEVMMFKWVHDWLDNSSHGAWIVVLDGADDFEKDGLKVALDCIPRSEHGNVLLTTRSKEIGVAFITSKERCIKVDVMIPEDAASLLSQNLTTRQMETSSDADAMSLVKALGYLPLAVYHAAAYLVHCSFLETPSSYLEDFSSNQASAEERLSWEGFTEEKGSLTPLRTFEKSFQQIEDQNAGSAHLLYLIGCFDAQRIDVSEIEQDLRPFELMERLRPLSNFCLITLDTNGKTFTMHRLVQLAIRYTLNRNGKRFGLQLEALGLVKRQYEVLQAERANKDTDGKRLQRNLQRELLRHFEVFYQYANTFHLPGWIPKLNSDDLSAVLLFARLLHRASRRAEAEYIQRLIIETRQPGSKMRAEPLLDLALSLQKRAKSPHDVRLIEASRRCREAERFALHAKATPSFMLKIKSTRALVYSDRHDFERALELQTEVFQQSTVEAGFTEDDIISAKSKLAMIQYAKGVALQQNEHIREGLDLQFQVVKAREKLICPGQSSLYLGRRFLINAQADVMRSHYALGNLKKAGPLAKMVVAERLILVGPDDLLTIDAEQDLAAVYRAQGLLGDAETLERDVLRRRVIRWGLGHDDVLHSARMLWVTLRKQSRYKDAHELVERYNIPDMEEEDVPMELCESAKEISYARETPLPNKHSREMLQDDTEYTLESWKRQKKSRADM
jgi:hypothetical protein